MPGKKGSAAGGGRAGATGLADRPVLLVNPFPGQSFYGVMVEHLGLAYLAAVLRNHGLEVAVREFQGGQCSGSHGRRAAPLGTEPILALPFRA